MKGELISSDTRRDWTQSFSPHHFTVGSRRSEPLACKKSLAAIHRADADFSRKSAIRQRDTSTTTFGNVCKVFLLMKLAFSTERHSPRLENSRQLNISVILS
jgi:hypothetical protein